MKLELNSTNYAVNNIANNRSCYKKGGIKVKGKINKMFSNDSVLIFIYIALMWVILSVVRNNLKFLTDDTAVLMFMNVLWIVILGFGTLALIAVFMHLKNHKERIYTEDIENGERFK
jgi:anaerobic C4-dicarboxylate transporter